MTNKDDMPDAADKALKVFNDVLNKELSNKDMPDSLKDVHSVLKRGREVLKQIDDEPVLKHCNVASVMCNRLYTQSHIDELNRATKSMKDQYEYYISELNTKHEAELKAQREACAEICVDVIKKRKSEGRVVGFNAIHECREAILNAKAKDDG